MSDSPRFASSAARAALLEALLRAEGHDNGASQGIPRRSGGGDPPLSYAQQRLWFLDRLVPGNPFYNIDAVIPIRAPISAAVLHRVLNQIVRRHEALRTTFAERGGHPVQIIAPSLEIPLPVVDLRELPREAREPEAQRLAMEDARTPFDLARGPLVRAKLVTIASDDHKLLLTMHHIVSDGWSMGVLSRELQSLYAALAMGRSAVLPELPIQYADFAVWQREWLQGQTLETQLDYWRKQLSALPTLALPTDRPRPAIPTFKGAFRPLAIPADLSESVRALARAESCTPFMVLLAAFKVLLSRYSGSDDIVVGAPIANRNRAEIEPLIGFFVNTLVLRTGLDGNPTFREVLGRVREVTLGAYAHQDLPFEMLVEELQPERDLSRNPLFQVIFQLFSTPAGHDAASDDTGPLPEIQRGNAKFDLRCDLWETAQGFRGQLEYSSDLFEEATAERFTEHYLRLLRAIVAEPGARISLLPLAGPREREQQLIEWNDTATPYPSDTGVHRLFDLQAARTPDATALDFGGERMTYAELDRRATRVAHRLHAAGVNRGDPVGIFLERSAEMVVAMLAILKAGGAYVPLDPSYPQARIAAMVEDVGASVVISTSRQAPALAGLVPRVVPIDSDPEPDGAGEAEPISAEVRGGDLAYVMFTSGSTGRPKGVCVPHRAIARLVLATDYVTITPDDAIAQASNASFDAATFEIWGALLNGARVVGIDRDTVLSPAALSRVLPATGVTVLFLTTTLFNQLVAEAPRSFATLRVVLTGGEAADPRSMARFLSANPGVQLLNVYGPTESTTFATAYRVTEVDEGAAQIPIGRPIANTRAYVLDRHGELSPIGVPGELYLGGDGLAEGYWEAADLTGERFVPDPLGVEPRGRLYRTGDLVRMRSDGNIEFIGRLDHQVKVRGFRVELPEIETVLAQHPAVRQSVVTLDRGEGEDARVVAYVVADARHFEEAAADAGTGAAAGERTAMVEQWKDVFESIVYDSIENQLQPRAESTFNIMGWNSSYTGEPIPAEEMREQVEGTVGRISATSPDRVLEIGCGTGLLLFRLAPRATRFVGTDFSPAALEFVGRVLEQEPERYGEVELLQRVADDFEGLAPGSFDTVILNSVVQYLPSIHDLLRVLDGALRVLAPGGTIFLGDLRSYSLLHALHTSVQLFRAPDELTVGELRERIQRDVQQEQELTIDPALWSYLQELYPQISSVQVQQKRGAHGNELTRFRYDVRLTVHGARQEPPPVAWRHWSREEMDVATVGRLLDEDAPAQLGFRHVPNARLRMEAATLSLLEAIGDSAPVGSLRAAARTAAGPGIEPEELWRMAEARGYEALIRWPDSGGPEGEMDVLFVRRGERAPPERCHFAPARPPEARLTDFANNPLQGKFVRNLVPHLQQFLADRLPEYMAPSAYVLLDVLPLTPNGKVDRAALPRPDRARPRLTKAFVPPRSEVEDQLAQIWSNVLGVDEVGVDDSFFTELGGHSLLATQVVSRVREVFRVELPLRSMFETPTIAELAATIESLRQAPAASQATAPMTAAIADDALDVGQLSDEEVDRMLRELGAGGATPEPRS